MPQNRRTIIEPTVAAVSADATTQFTVDKVPVIVALLGSGTPGLGEFVRIHRVDTLGNVRDLNALTFNIDDSAGVVGALGDVMCGTVISVSGTYRLSKDATAGQVVGAEIMDNLAGLLSFDR